MLLVAPARPHILLKLASRNRPWGVASDSVAETSLPLDSLLRRDPVYASGPTTAASSAVLSLLPIEVRVWFPTEAVCSPAAPSLHSFLVKSMRIDYFGGSRVVAAAAVANADFRGVPTLTSFANALGHVRFFLAGEVSFG